MDSTFFMNKGVPQEHKFANCKETNSGTPLHLELNKNAKRLGEERIRERREGNGDMAQRPRCL